MAPNSLTVLSMRNRTPVECSSRCTSDLSTRPVSASSTASAGSGPPAQTHSVASRSNPEANADSRAHNSRSAGVHSSWLQPIAARNDSCRAGPRTPVSRR